MVEAENIEDGASAKIAGVFRRLSEAYGPLGGEGREARGSTRESMIENIRRASGGIGGAAAFRDIRQRKREKSDG